MRFGPNFFPRFREEVLTADRIPLQHLGGNQKFPLKTWPGVSYQYLTKCGQESSTMITTVPSFTFWNFPPWRRQMRTWPSWRRLVRAGTVPTAFAFVTLKECLISSSKLLEVRKKCHRWFCFNSLLKLLHCEHLSYLPIWCLILMYLKSHYYETKESAGL